METKEQLLQELESLKKRIENLDKPFKLETGKWYKDNSGILVFITEFRKNDVIGYGFSNTNQWRDLSKWLDDYMDMGLKLATPSEVESALIKEAEKRGFKEGIIVISAHSKVNKVIPIKYDDIKYQQEGNRVHYNGICIFEDGQWATIIKDEPIKIGGYEVKINDSGSFDIGCKKGISNGKIRVLRRLMIQCNFKTVSFDGTDVSLETINKILNL